MTPTISELEPVLRGVFFLKGPDAALRESFAALAMCRSYPRNNILFHHGEPSHAFYIVVKGRVKVSLTNADGREVILTSVGPGSPCGIVAAADGGPHFGTATTLADSRLAVIPRDRFGAWLDQRPALKQEMMIELAQMLRDAYTKLGEQALLPVKRRLLAALVEIARAEGRPEKDGEVVFVRPTHQELADRVGTTRVVVSRALKELLNEDENVEASGRVLRVRLHALLQDPDF